MNLLVDTNVLISAALRDGLPESVVVYVATQPECRWIVTSDILDEYTQVLRRPKFGFAPETLASWTELIQMRTITVSVPPVSGMSLPRDPEDTFLLAAAVASNADYLITGDRDLLESKIEISTRIVSVGEFATAFRIE